MSSRTAPAAGAVPTAAELIRLLDAEGAVIYAIDGQSLSIVDIFPAHPSACSLTSGDTHGCLLVGNASGLAEFRDAAAGELARRFDDAVAAGELSDVDTLLLARWISAICQGISIQARSGADREELHAIADLALAGWPKP